eukprot:8368044-Alexandrium_andersonii.AAC.1
MVQEAQWTGGRGATGVVGDAGPRRHRPAVRPRANALGGVRHSHGPSRPILHPSRRSAAPVRHHHAG